MNEYEGTFVLAMTMTIYEVCGHLCMEFGKIYRLMISMLLL